jgi:ferredoxin
MKTLVLYCSPAGSTQQVAQTMAGVFSAQGHATECFNVGVPQQRAAGIRAIRAAGPEHCLCIGSPVYACHALEPVMDLIAALPESGRGHAVVFVTWGCVTSGLALCEMAEALSAKGYRIAGAGAFPAAHSMVLSPEEEFGAQRPDAADLDHAQTLAAQVSGKLSHGAYAPVGLSSLSYQPDALRESMLKISLRGVRGRLPALIADEQLCTDCGQCVEFCPVQAVSIHNGPVFSDACIMCYGCAQCCPEKAIVADLAGIEVTLRQRAESFSEPARARIIV